MKRLMDLTLRDDLTVGDEVAARILSLPRAELRRYLALLRRRLRRASVSVAVEGGDAAVVVQALQGRFPGRSVEVVRAEGTGAGVRLTAGDDVLDVSVTGYLRKVMQELGGT